MQTLWVIDCVFSPSRARYNLITLLKLGVLALDDLSDGTSAHDSPISDGRDIESSRVGALGDPAALGRVIGDVEGFYEDLAVLQGRKGVGFEGEGWFRAGELREVCGFLGEDPFFCMCWSRHGGGWWLEGLG